MSIKIRKRPANSASAAAVTAYHETVPQELLTIRQAMKIAQVSDATLRRWIRTRALSAYKLGGQVRIDKADLLKFLQPWSPQKYCEYLK